MDKRILSDNELGILLSEFISKPCETEVFEFKKAEKSFGFGELCKYFSALSNEACLKDIHDGWLIFGVRDEDRSIAGTEYKNERASLDSLKYEISKKTGGISFREIYEIKRDGKRVIMFQIPAAVSIPTTIDGHAYGREGESICALCTEKADRIRRFDYDWSSEIVKDATVADLSPEAITKARENFKVLNTKLAAECDNWDDITFLNKAKQLKSGKVTNSTIVLLGKNESEHFIGSSTKIRWKLINSKGSDKDFAIFGLPMLFSINEAGSKIRNLGYRFLKAGDMSINEIETYEPSTIRESLSNAVAHQDYGAKGFINLIESEEGYFEVTNIGSFLPSSVESVVKNNSPHEMYRNPFLVSAMRELGLVDTVGGGIRKMYENQARRFFPLPEYDLSNNRVNLRIYGKTTNNEYSMTLVENPELRIEEIIMLDKLRKKIKLDENEIKTLREKNLVKGRSTMLSFNSHRTPAVSGVAVVGRTVAGKTKIKNDILQFIKFSGPVSRAEVECVFMNEMSEDMTDIQRKNKISNTLRSMTKQELIKNIGSLKNSKYVFNDTEFVE